MASFILHTLYPSVLHRFAQLCKTFLILRLDLIWRGVYVCCTLLELLFPVSNYNHYTEKRRNPDEMLAQNEMIGVPTERNGKERTFFTTFPNPNKLNPASQRVMRFAPSAYGRQIYLKKIESKTSKHSSQPVQTHRIEG